MINDEFRRLDKSFISYHSDYEFLASGFALLLPLKVMMRGAGETAPIRFPPVGGDAFGKTLNLYRFCLPNL